MKARWRFLGISLSKALSNRPSRVVLLVAALAITATLATALVAVSLGIEARLGESLKAFGANIVVEPAAQSVGAGGLALGEVGAQLDPVAQKDTIARVSGVESVVPQVRTNVSVQGADIAVVGMDPTEMASARWKLTGAIPARGQALVGVDLANRFHLKQGSAVPGMNGVGVAGVVESGSQDDSAIVLRIDDALALSGGRVSQFLVRADPSRVDAVAADIARADPTLASRTVRQVADAERSLLDKVRLLLVMVTVSVGLVCAIAVGNTLTIVVLERVEEIGLLKAMGATRGFVVGYFALEETVVALVGGALGLIAGIAVAELVAVSVFGSSIAVSPVAWVTPFIVALGVTALAGALPVFRAATVDASSTLKGL